MQPPVLGRMDNVAAGHWGQAQVAAHQMQVVARQQDDLACPYHEVFSDFAFNPYTKVALEDVVINDQMGCTPEGRCAMLGPDSGRDAPRCKELGV